MKWEKKHRFRVRDFEIFRKRERERCKIKVKRGEIFGLLNNPMEGKHRNSFGTFWDRLTKHKSVNILELIRLCLESRVVKNKNLL